MVINMYCLTIKYTKRMIPTNSSYQNRKSEIFCKIKHMARRCNEDSIIYCLVTSQVLKVQLHLSLVLTNSYCLAVKYNKIMISKISSSKMEKKGLFCL